LIKIEGKEVLKYIIERLERVFDKASIIIATSDNSSDDVIEHFAKKETIRCYRGSLENVASRFYEAARSQKWQYAIRINGDNIFVDTDILRAMTKILHKENYDFITNVKDRTFPMGMSIEIVRLDYYQKALEKICKTDRYKEHVTLYFYEKDPPENHYLFYNTFVPEAAGIQLALDTPEDLERTRKIIKEFSRPHWEYNLEEIFRIWRDLGYE